jgi:hypothetical protein
MKKQTGMIATMLLAGMVGMSACASAPATAGAGTAAAGGASSLGLSDVLLQVAMQAAQGFLTNKTAANPTQMPSVEDKTAAAQAGVDAAVTKAKDDGKEITEQQKTGLLDYLKGALK